MSSKLSKTLNVMSSNGAALRTTLVKLFDRPRLNRHHRDDLLRQHVKSISGIVLRLDCPCDHLSGLSGTGKKISPVFWKQNALAGNPDLMSGSADALQRSSNAWRRLDLNDKIDGTHVDAELQRGGCDNCRQTSRFKILFDHRTLFASNRSVVRANDLFAGQFIEGGGKPLRKPPGIDKNQGGPMLSNQVQDARMNRRPDTFVVRSSSAGCLSSFPTLTHVLDRDFDANVEVLPGPGIDDLHVPSRAAKKTRGLVERPYSGREPIRWNSRPRSPAAVRAKESDALRASFRSWHEFHRQ